MVSWTPPRMFDLAYTNPDELLCCTRKEGSSPHTVQQNMAYARKSAKRGSSSSRVLQF